MYLHPNRKIQFIQRVFIKWDRLRSDAILVQPQGNVQYVKVVVISPQWVVEKKELVEHVMEQVNVANAVVLAEQNKFWNVRQKYPLP